MAQKRYQYWGSKDGKPQKMWTKWFNVKDGDNKEPLQIKGLKNEYKN
jgi:hypothetical protein